MSSISNQTIPHQAGRYHAAFSRLKTEGRGAFVPFVTLGDPSPELSMKIIDTLVQNGADALELGFPFSDPMAEGPPIQRAALREFASTALTVFVALFAMGVHSTFFGPIKYAILPQHLHKDEVLAGTGLVEAGTYVAILVGMMLGGAMPIMWSIVAVIVVALVGYIVCRWVPPAPAQTEETKVDWNPIRASRDLIAFSMGNLELRYSVLAISYFWAIAAILSVQFIPLAKNVLLADKQIAAVLLVAFSAGIAIGSVSINALLKGTDLLPS